MIIFIAGGVTYSEMRLAYTLSQSLGKDIYIGVFIPEIPVLMSRFYPYPDT
jgi:syntaxin-binding protein 1